MKLTAKQIDILKKVRWLIENECYNHICFAISNVETNDIASHSDSPYDYDNLSIRIRNLLTENYALEDWLENVVGIPYRQLTEKRMRYYRLRWLDHMISTKEL